MTVFWLIVQNTIRQGWRKRFLAGILAVCFVILCLSLFFAQISLDDKGRLSVDFGLAAIQLSLVALSVFFGTPFIAEDLEKKALQTILIRPVRPALFFFARYSGLAFLLLLGLILLSALLLVFFLFLKIPIQTVLFYALSGFFFESLFLLACVVLFLSYSNSFLTLFYCLSVFITGHFLESLSYFIEKTAGPTRFVLSELAALLPNLEKVNWKSAVVYQDKIPFVEFAFSSVYMLLWTGFVLSLSLMIMENREYP